MPLLPPRSSRTDPLLPYTTLVRSCTCIPLSALKGDNMLERSAATPWYGGEALLQHLETVKVEQRGQGTGFRMPVQWVCRPDHAFRGFARTVVAGGLAPGDAIAVLPPGQRSSVARIVPLAGHISLPATAPAITLDPHHALRGAVLLRRLSY